MYLDTLNHKGHYKKQPVLLRGVPKINYKCHYEGGTTEVIFKWYRENKRSRRFVARDDAPGKKIASLRSQ